MGGLTSFRAKNVGGRIFFPSHGGIKAVEVTSHYNGGTFLLIVYHYVISTKVDQKMNVY